MPEFGIVLRRLNFPFYSNYAELSAAAKEAEDLGYDSIWVNDHLLSKGPYGGPNFPYFECWTVITALSRDTSRIKIGSLASCSAFRHPSILAKSIATIDSMSNGRVIPILGAGSYKEEHEAYGIPFYPPNERVERFIEYLQILKKIWTEKEPSFNGKYYQIKGASGNPEPVQKPHPPLWVGCHRPRMVKVAADFADGWNYDAGGLTVDEAREKMEIIKDGWAETGRKPKRFTFSLWNNVFIGSKDEIKEQMGVHEKYGSVVVGQGRDQISLSFSGEPEEVVRKIEPFLKIGFTHFMLFFATRRAKKLFAEKVISAL